MILTRRSRAIRPLDFVFITFRCSPGLAAQTARKRGLLSIGGLDPAHYCGRAQRANRSTITRLATADFGTSNICRQTMPAVRRTVHRSIANIDTSIPPTDSDLEVNADNSEVTETELTFVGNVRVQQGYRASVPTKSPSIAPASERWPRAM